MRKFVILLSVFLLVALIACKGPTETPPVETEEVEAGPSGITMERPRPSSRR